MPKSLIPYTLFLIIGIFPFILFAQEKFEKESRINRKDVPIKALQFIDSLDLKTKIKWYKEEGLTKESIEAKFTHHKVKYSVEFNTLGSIEDVEVGTKWNSLNSKLTDAISLQLKTDCLKTKIDKVQIQYSGDESALFSQIKTNENFQDLSIKYELIVKCNFQNKVELFEYLFSDEGKLLSTSKILFKSSSHLEY